MQVHNIWTYVSFSTILSFMAKMDERTYTSPSGKNYSYRNLNLADSLQFIHFRQKIACETTHTMQYVGMPLPTPEDLQKRLQNSIDDKLTLNLGIFYAEELVGYLNFRVPWGDHPWAKHIGQFGMMILQEHWGQGIGQLMLATLEQFAQSIGITRIEAMVRVANKRGLQLYERNGYVVEGLRASAALIENEMQDEYFIAKIIDHKASCWQPPVLNTDRLLLRPIELKDAKSIFSYAKNPNVCRYTLWEAHNTEQDSLNYIRDYVFKYYRKGVPEPFGIALKQEPEKLIGTVGCFWVLQSAKSMELAYALAEEYWGQGLVAEASLAVMDYCFKEFGLNRIQARCKAENSASARVMEKIGMSYEGTLKSASFHRDRYWDMKYYAKIKS